MCPLFRTYFNVPSSGSPLGEGKGSSLALQYVCWSSWPFFHLLSLLAFALRAPFAL